MARIRDIRSSEKVFWLKVFDVYATSIDYDPKTGAIMGEYFKPLKRLKSSKFLLTNDLSRWLMKNNDILNQFTGFHIR